AELLVVAADAVVEAEERQAPVLHFFGRRRLAGRAQACGEVLVAEFGPAFRRSAARAVHRGGELRQGDVERLRRRAAGGLAQRAALGDAVLAAGCRRRRAAARARGLDAGVVG